MPTKIKLKIGGKYLRKFTQLQSYWDEGFYLEPRESIVSLLAVSKDGKYAMVRKQRAIPFICHVRELHEIDAA